MKEGEKRNMWWLLTAYIITSLHQCTLTRYIYIKHRHDGRSEKRYVVVTHSPRHQTTQ